MGGFLLGTDPTLRKTKTPTVDTFAAGVGFTAGSSTTVTLSDDPGTEKHLTVFFDGVGQHRSTYSVSGTTVTFDTAIPTGTAEVEATFASTVPSVTVPDDSVTLAKLAGGTDGNIISFDASGNPVAIATGNDGQVLTSAGAGQPPAFETISSNAHKEFWLQPLHGTTAATDAASTRVIGSGTTDFLVKNSDTGHTVHFQWQMPADFSSLTSLLVVNIPDAGETFQWDVESDYGLIGEDHQTNSESQADQTGVFVNEQFVTIDVSGVFSSVTALDICGVHIFPDTNTLHTVGLRCVYA